MAKFAFKGKNLEELSKMSLEDFSKLIPSRSRRALKRGFTAVEKKLLEDMRKGPAKYHKVQCREMVVIPEMVGKKIGLYNGKEYITLDIKESMLGHRLGEFVLTRKPVKHSSPGFGATKSSKFVPLK
jgi:small subunit ribosomal protein S19